MDREVESSKSEMEADNEGASSIKRRRVHGSEIGDLPDNFLLVDSLENSTSTLLQVMIGEMTCDYVKSTDLKGGEDSETVASTFMSGELSRDTSESGEISGEESGEEAMDSPSSTTRTRKRKSSPRECCVAKTPPSTAEIDEFFSAAEKSQQQRFAKKYNYDIVKDVPMEGRFQWIPLKSFD